MCFILRAFLSLHQSGPYLVLPSHTRWWHLLLGSVAVYRMVVVSEGGAKRVRYILNFVFSFTIIDQYLKLKVCCLWYSSWWPTGSVVFSLASALFIYLFIYLYINVYLVLWPIFWLGHLFFWNWAVGVACIFLRLILCQLLHLLLFSLILKAVFSPCLIVSFVVQKLLILIRSHLFISSFIYTPMFITALFIIARTWKQLRCPSADEWIRQLWYINTMKYYSAIKKNTFESVLMRWMKLEPIIQSEVSQKEKHQYSILMHIYGI